MLATTLFFYFLFYLFIYFFIRSNDRELELKVRDRDQSDLESALRSAIRIETHLRAYEAEHERETGREGRNKRDRYDDNRVRQLGRPANAGAEADDAAEPVLIKVLAQLEKAQKDKDEMEKELGRLRLLAEQAKAPQVVQKTDAEAEFAAERRPTFRCKPHQQASVEKGDFC